MLIPAEILLSVIYSILKDLPFFTILLIHMVPEFMYLLIIEITV